MKKLLIGAIAAMTLTFVCGTVYGKIEATNDLYPISTKVVSLDYTMDKVTVQQANGTLWIFYGCDDWELNDNCDIIMDNNGTPEVYDDIIVDYRYSM